MVRLVYTERGRLGVWRKYQHPRFGTVETITMWGVGDSADVTYVGHKHGWQLVANPIWRRKMAREAGIPRKRMQQTGSLQLLSFDEGVANIETANSSPIVDNARSHRLPGRRRRHPTSVAPCRRRDAFHCVSLTEALAP